MSTEKNQKERVHLNMWKSCLQLPDALLALNWLDSTLRTTYSLTKRDGRSKIALLYYRIWSLNSELSTYQNTQVFMSSFILNRKHDEEGRLETQGITTPFICQHGRPPSCLVPWCSTPRWACPGKICDGGVCPFMSSSIKVRLNLNQFPDGSFLRKTIVDGR